MLEQTSLQFIQRLQDNLNDSIKLIKKLNKKVGISLNPESKIDLIKIFR